MSRTLEAIFRRSIRLVLILLLFPIVGLAVGYILPRSYESSATLWAIRRYQIIGSTGAESNLLASPADTQATALNELLKSHSFVLAVAKAANQSADTQSSSSAQDEALANRIPSNVRVVSQGYNTYTVTYTDTDPQLAQRVTNSLLNTFGTQSQVFSVAEANRLIDTYEAQLPQAKDDADRTAKASEQYIIDHPDRSRGDLTNDPQYQLLDSQAQQARTRLQYLEDQIANLKQEIATQGTGNEGLFKIIDKPTLPTRPSSLVKQLLFGGGAGLIVALLACAIYLVILIRRDRAIYSASDLLKITDLPITLEIPQLEQEEFTFLIGKMTAGLRLPQVGTNS